MIHIMFGCVLGVSEVKNWNDLYNIVNIQEITGI